MVLTQLTGIAGTIGAIFTGITVVLALAVRVEQWLDRSELPGLAAADQQWVEPDDSPPEPKGVAPAYPGRLTSPTFGNAVPGVPGLRALPHAGAGSVFVPMGNTAGHTHRPEQPVDAAPPTRRASPRKTGPHAA